MNEKIAAALKSIDPAVNYKSDNPKFQDLVVAARSFPAALRLAAAVDGWADDSHAHPRKEMFAALDAFLAALPEVEK
jgi:hypothetical protein